MKKLLTSLLLFFLISCSSWNVKWKKDHGPKANLKDKSKNQSSSSKKDDLIDKEAGENWAKNYYQGTYFEIKNPKLLESKEELEAICKSPDKSATLHYQDIKPQKISFKTNMVTFTTRDGFSKKVYISKGACRELVLFRNQSLPKAKQIRKLIDKVTLSYIYNEGTYLKRIEFKTPFKTVKFIVE